MLAALIASASIANGQLLISQYYEGASSDKYLELHNPTAGPILVDGYQITLWSNDNREAWKTGGTATNAFALPMGTTIPAGGYFLLKNSSANLPTYASSGPSVATGVCNFNGDDSVVLYNGTVEVANIVDAFSVTANTAGDKSLYRIANATGYDLTIGTNYTNFTEIWAEKTNAEVAGAAPTDLWYLTGLAPTQSLTLSITPDIFSEAAGTGAATATVTRSGPTDTDLIVTVTVNDLSEASAQAEVTIPATFASADFPIDAVNDVVTDGDQLVTVTVSATGFANGSDIITVQDDGDVTVPPQILISQYYEGASNDKYVELQNITAGPVTMDGYTLTSWTNAGSENWKTNTGAPGNSLSLNGITIPAGGFYLVKNSQAVEPTAVSPGADISSTVTFFNGDDSVVLFYNGVGDLLGDVADALSFPDPLNVGGETSFYRLNNNIGYNRVLGSTPLDFPTVWGQKTVEEVNNAVPTDDFYLKSGNPNGPLTLTLSPASVSESAVGVASVGTVTRGGDLTAELVVDLASSDTTEATVLPTATIPAGETSVTFDITAQDDTEIDGPQKVNITASANLFVTGLAILTVQDDEPRLVTINEILADPAANIAGDANGDGVGNGVSDEFIELVNTSGQSIDMSGWVIIDATNVPVHIFPDGTILEADRAIVVFGGPTPTGSFGGAIVQVSSEEGGLSFNNGGDTIVLLSSTQEIVDILTFGSEASIDQSRSLSPDLTGFFTNHSDIPAAGGTLFSPGTRADGTPFGSTGGDSYSGWIAGFDVNGQTAGDDDFDNDGIGNALENYFGSDPSTSSVGISMVSGSSTSVVFQHNRSKAAAFDVTPSYEWSTDLVSWNPSGAAEGITVVIGTPELVTPGTSTDLVEVTASVTSGTATRLFVRVKASILAQD